MHLSPRLFLHLLQNPLQQLPRLELHSFGGVEQEEGMEEVEEPWHGGLSELS